MAAYVILGNLTEKGAADIKAALTALRERTQRAAERGITVKALYVTQGVYDLAALVEGEEQAVMAGLFALAADGLVRTTTLRAFSLDEVDQILGRTA
ncbi:MAG: GYD domain-containing protein [Chloroflexota bacterium]|nr:GYD domain-containing protein [Dehalococcoidia bacterium]MDW8254700.1 GYD domain-containing protein [Chloroflexota bacterium]